MNESRIQTGTKVKITRKPSGTNGLKYASEGDVGYISTDSYFHNKGEVKDSDGWYWIRIPAKNNSLFCMPQNTEFKVLCYAPKETEK